MDTEQRTTYFAPAERAANEDVQLDFAAFNAQDLMKTMLDAVPDMVLILNQNRQAVFTNRAAVSQLGFQDKVEALGQRPGELVNCVHAHEMPGGCGTSEFCRNCGAVRAIITSLKGKEAVEECRISLQDGDSLDLRVTARPLYLNDQIFSSFAVQDISSEKRRQALERIFFHDVLNTAGIVSMCAEVLKFAPEMLPSVLDDLETGTQRLIEEIKGQRTLLAAETGELQIDFVPVNIRQLTNELAKQFERHPVAEDRKVVVFDDFDSRPFKSDATILGRILGNMLKNALEASLPGDTVTLSYEYTDDQVVFAINNPTSMPRNIQLQIFNRSFSTKGAGRGLGTYSMKMLSERYLNGKVWFESSEAQGTTFYASYPLDPT